MYPIKISKRDLTRDLSEKICFLYFINSGAQGNPGNVLFITNEAKIYCFNYLYGNITIDDVVAFFPALAKRKDDDWKREHLELWGHVVFISKSIYEAFSDEINVKRPVFSPNFPILPFNWLDTALKVVKETFQTSTTKENKILDIIINLLKGIKNKNSIIEELEKDVSMALNGCAYLLNQTLRQYKIPENHYFVSEKALELWNKISTEDIFNYTYRDKVTKNTNDTVVIDKYKGGEKYPSEKEVPIKKGDTFIYNDVFTDEHIVTVSDIIEELLQLQTYDYLSITKILDKMYICKMLKSEDRKIQNKKKRSTDYKKVINEEYLKVGIKVKNFNHEEKSVSRKQEEPKKSREKVKHAKFGEGEIISIKNDVIKVVFGGLQIKEFPYPSSINNGTLTYVKPCIVIPQITLSKNCNYFFCFQGVEYDNEYKGGYIFALANKGVSHWDRLQAVKVGDIILHCCEQKISSVSIVQREARLESRPITHFLANNKKGKEGWLVKTEYRELKNPIITSQYKKEIVKLQGAHEGKGYPFNKNGEGNQGYLFNLNRALVEFFIQKIIQSNPDIKTFIPKAPAPTIQPKFVQCPICGINWMKETEGCCKICAQKPQNNGNMGGGGGGKHPTAFFNEYFTFTNEVARLEGESGYKAYNSKGENVGIVFETTGAHTFADGHCELRMYPKYYNRYGKYHRIKSNGGRIKWSKLCEILSNKGKYTIFID